MTQDYFPSGPFLSELPDRGEFDVLREDFLLEFANVRTARAYKTDLEDFRESCEDSAVDPLHPSATNLEDYVRLLSDHDYAAGTIARRVAALRGFLEHLVTRGILQTSPALGLSRPKT